MKKILCSIVFVLAMNHVSYAQFTICERCGEQRQGNKIIIEGENKGNWTVKYNLFGHTTTFYMPDKSQITLKNSGNKTENANGTTTRQTVSEDGNWQAEVIYKGHSFVSATLIKVR